MILIIAGTCPMIYGQEVVEEIQVGEKLMTNDIFDSATTQHYKAAFNPSKAVVKEAMYLAFEMVLDDHYLPLQLFNLSQVKRMKVKSAADQGRSFVLEFNSKGQWVRMLNTTDTLSVIYKNEVPYRFTNKNGLFHEFHYSGDTVISMNNRITRFYKLKGRNFHRINRSSEQAVAYSNTNWNLPLTITYKESQEDEGWNLMTERYFNDSLGNLILDKTLGARRGHLVYQMENGRPVKLSSFRQIVSGDGMVVKKTDPNPDIRYIEYEYFEK